ncbi:MAG: beta-galactosidase [Limisphaerales bacterium]
MRRGVSLLVMLGLVLGWVCVVGSPAVVRVGVPSVPTSGEYLGLGETNAPGGHSLGADSLSLYRDGERWMPVMGEFHYARYPREEWRDALLKMKAGGIQVVASYVFWIHHEEVRGEYDWSGRRSLREFLELCREVDLLAVVRMGPWCHGEARNGGFPEWLKSGGAGVEESKLRSADPDFLKLVEAFYREVAGQMEGLLWKDGGPVIGVQLDNESGDLEYLLALKRLARGLGVDVPFYAMTGWSGVVPEEGLLPLFGGYADGFWSAEAGDFADAYDFSPVRSQADPENQKLSKFPYLCCEIGGGMASSYENRVAVFAGDTEALALAKLGSGNNLPGYYMFQGGQNPESKAGGYHESVGSGAPNELPVVDYDFDAPLGAYGQVRESYDRLRLLHVFLKDFGTELAGMPAWFPEARAGEGVGVKWSVRSDGGSGLLFFSNHEAGRSGGAVTNVQFSVGLTNGVQLVPREPIVMPGGAAGYWPVRWDFGGVRVDYATVQPVARIEWGEGLWFFFLADKGVPAEVAFAGEDPRRCEPGMGVAFRRVVALEGGGERVVHFVVLPPHFMTRVWKLELGGSDRLLLAANAFLPEVDGVARVELLQPNPLSVAMFPPMESVKLDGLPAAAGQDGVFGYFNLPRPSRKAGLELKLVRPAKGEGAKGKALAESEWERAAVWKVQVPETVAGEDLLMRIMYVGDVARLYAGGRMVADQFYHGLPFDFGLWRLPQEEWGSLELRVMPLSLREGLRVPSFVERLMGEASSKAELANYGLLERRQHRLEVIGVKEVEP